MNRFRRRPAWTDRILFRCNEFNDDRFSLGLALSDYGSHADAVDCSDHAPVTAHFEVNCFSPQARTSPEGIILCRKISDNGAKPLILE